MPSGSKFHSIVAIRDRADAGGIFDGNSFRHLLPACANTRVGWPAAQAYLRVPIGIATDMAFLGVSLSASAWLGLGWVVAGVAAMTIPSRKSRQQTA
jgi:hypothetical protein